MDINTLIESAKNAIFYIEDVEAKKILKEIAVFSNTQNQINPELAIELKKINIYLKIVAFPNLTNEESADVLRNYYLESFEIGVPMENQLIGKLFLEPIIPRDALRQYLKQALLENNQLVGALTISQWIQEFEKDFNVHTRKTSSIIDFVTSNSKARQLEPLKQNILKKILHTYDYLLVSTIPTTEPELSNLLASINLEDTSRSNIPNGTKLDDFSEKINIQDTQNLSPNKNNIIKTSLSDALKNYPELGEQLITSNRIKLKNFPEPVRPSINNWLSDYTFSLGFESHSAMDRGTYLFRNENSKMLSSTDREKISYILKAYDENSLVDVNVNTKQIIFPKREQSMNSGIGFKPVSQSLQSEPNYKSTPVNLYSQAPQRNIQEIYNSQKQEAKPKDIFREERTATENRNTENINFSSPQKLPYEKQTIQPIQPQNIRNNSGDSNKPRTNPNVPPGNIVNLKDPK